MNQISFQYPTWFLILCVLAGLVYAFTLYYRDNTFREHRQRLNGFLGVLRFLAVTTLAVLLLSPLLRSIETETKKPIVVLAQDASESLALAIDSLESIDYQNQINELKDKLAENYEVQEYSFGDEVRKGMQFDFEDKVSNISDLFGVVYDLYSNQNLGAIVLATDGIYNEGSNPIYAGAKLPVPLYAIALGDTTPKRDVLLKRIFHNKIAYLGDKFAVQVDVSAHNFSGNTTTLNTYKVNNGQITKLNQTPITIDANNFFKTVEVVLDADKNGVQQYRFSLGQLEGEQSIINNRKDIFIDVLDARQKILILANSPHPDISAFRQSITTNKNYQLDVAYAEDVNIDVSNYDMVILHQLPSRKHDISNTINKLRNKKVPTLYVIGAQTDLNKFNKSQSLLNIRPSGANINEVQAQIAKDFSLFTLSEEFRKEVSSFVPLQAPFGDFKLIGNGQVLLNQRIGKIDTQYPLLVLGEQDNLKTGILCAEGIWQWRLFDFLQRENHDISNELIGKTIQYLSLKEDKRRFRVSLPKNVFDENESVILDAELYNNSYELINEPDVSVVITDSEDRNFNYVFTKTATAYSLNAGILPAGNYAYQATTDFNGERLAFNGRFSVQAVQLELYETTADHGLLRRLSEEYGGQLVFQNQINTISTLIEASGKVKPVIYESTKTRPIIDLKAIFFLVLFLLSLEWFLRRYFGAY